MLFPLAVSLAAEDQSTDFDLFKARKQFKLGWTYYQIGKYQLAIESFNKALAAKPKFSPARVWLGKSYFQAGYVENAVEEWQTAVDLGLDDNLLRERLNTLLATRGSRPEFDIIEDYAYFNSIAGHRMAKGAFVKPASFLVTPANEIFAAGFLSRSVAGFDINGRVVASFGPGLTGFERPFGICRDAAGNFFVSDFGRDRIYKFSAGFKKLLEFGLSGITNAAFAGPEGLAVDRNGQLLVVDNGNDRVQRFSADGEFLASFGTKGSGRSELYRPSGVCLDADGNIFVSDFGNHRIQKFDEDGNWLETIGENVLAGPRGLKIRKDLLIAADGPNGLFFYDLRERFWWKKSFWNGGEFRFANAVDIAFSPVNDILYAADFDRNTIDMFMPAPFKYSDLVVDVKKLSTGGYPGMALFVTVAAKNNKPLSGLTADNFAVWEDGVRVPAVSLDRSFAEKNSIVFLSDKSRNMEPFDLEIGNAADYILNARRDADRIKVIDVNEKVWTGLDWDTSRLRVLDKLREERFTEDVNLGLGLYQAVSETAPINNRKAVVLFTAGVFDPDLAFRDHTFDTVLNYCRNNLVPVFIVAFTEENRVLLERLAAATGGEYYYYFENQKRLKNVYGAIDGQTPRQYILLYQTSRGTAQQKWRDVRVDVSVRDLSGRDTTGYFLP
jgi:sugar lactone lactonase YvrE